MRKIWGVRTQTYPPAVKSKTKTKNEYEKLQNTTMVEETLHKLFLFTEAYSVNNNEVVQKGYTQNTFLS